MARAKKRPRELDAEPASATRDHAASIPSSSHTAHRSKRSRRIPPTLRPPHAIIEYSPHPISQPGSLLSDLQPLITTTRAFAYELGVSLQLLTSLGPLGVLEYWKSILSSFHAEFLDSQRGSSIIGPRRKVLEIVHDYSEIYEQGLGSTLGVESEKVTLLRKTVSELINETGHTCVVYVSDDITARVLTNVLNSQNSTSSFRQPMQSFQAVAILADVSKMDATELQTGLQLEEHNEKKTAGLWIVPATNNQRLVFPMGCHIIHFDEFDRHTRAILQPGQGENHGSYLTFIDRDHLELFQDFIQGTAPTEDVKRKSKARDVDQSNTIQIGTAITSPPEESHIDQRLNVVSERRKTIDPIALPSSWSLDLQGDNNTIFNGVGTNAMRSIRFLRHKGNARKGKLEIASTGRIITLPYAKSKVKAYFLSLNADCPALQLMETGSDIFSCKIEMPSCCPVSGVEWTGKAGTKKAIAGLAYATICLKLYLAGELSDDWAEEPLNRGKISKKCKRSDVADAGGEKIHEALPERPQPDNVKPDAAEVEKMGMAIQDPTENMAGQTAKTTLPSIIRQPPSIAVAGYGDMSPVSVDEAATLLPPTRSRHPQKLPDFWWSCLPTEAGMFAATIMQIVSPDPGAMGESPFRPFCILTTRRLPLPQGDEFPIYDNGNQLCVRFKTASTIQLTPEKLQSAHIFTLRLQRMMLNHALIQNISDCPYFIVPLIGEAIFDRSSGCPPNIESQISWQEINSQLEIPLSSQFNLTDLGTLREQCKDAFVSTPDGEFSRRYRIVCLRTDLNPLSTPEDIQNNGEPVTIMKHTKSESKNWNVQQPIFEVQLVSACENMLQVHSTNVTEVKDDKAYKYLIPEGVRRCGFGYSVLRTALAIPSVMTRLDSFLLVKEMKARFFDSHVDELDILAALTPPGRHEHRDYDRLEFFGDSILKLIATAYIYTASPEEINTLRRSQINDNAELRLAMVKSEAVDYIQPMKFVVKKWRPLNCAGYRGSGIPSPPALLPNTFSRDRYRVHELAFKTPADVAEALIAVATFSGGIASGFKICKQLGLNLPGVESWSVLADMAARPESSVSPLPKDIQTQLESTIRYTFVDKTLTGLAMTDPLILGPALNSQMKLVFLGDSLLDYLAADSLYVKDEDDLKPGELNRWKAGMTNNQAIAALAVQFGLDDLVRYGAESERSRSEVECYKRALGAARHSQPSNKQPWREVHPPKFLHDMVKAIFAVALLDGGWSLDGPREMFRTLFETFVARHMYTIEDVEQHPRQLLMELLERKGCNGLQNVTIETKTFTDGKGRGGPTLRTKVSWHGFLLAFADGPKSRIAVRDACRTAMNALLQDAEDDQLFRQHCNCT